MNFPDHETIMSGHRVNLYYQSDYYGIDDSMCIPLSDPKVWLRGFNPKTVPKTENILIYKISQHDHDWRSRYCFSSIPFQMNVYVGFWLKDFSTRTSRSSFDYSASAAPHSLQHVAKYSLTVENNNKWAWNSFPDKINRNFAADCDYSLFFKLDYTAEVLSLRQTAINSVVENYDEGDVATLKSELALDM